MSYRVCALGPDRVRRAFPLVQAVHPGLSFDDWRRYARSHVDRRAGIGPAACRGILCFENEHGCIEALFTFRAEPDLDHGRVLLCDYLAAIDPLNPRRALATLIGAFRERACEAGCRAIRLAMPRALTGLVSELADSGCLDDWVDYAITVGQTVAGERAGIGHA